MLKQIIEQVCYITFPIIFIYVQEKDKVEKLKKRIEERKNKEVEDKMNEAATKI